MGFDRITLLHNVGKQVHAAKMENGTKTVREMDHFTIGWLSNFTTTGCGQVECFVNFSLDREDGLGKVMVGGDCLRVARDRQRMLIGCTKVTNTFNR